MTKKEYNGWTNYETWLVKLWIDNNEGDHLYWREQAERAFPDGTEVRDLATQLRDAHEETIYEALPKHLHASFIMDLMNAAMSEVNWEEIAESLLNAAKERIAQ